MAIIERDWTDEDLAKTLLGPWYDSGPCREAARRLQAKAKPFPTVYTVIEISPDFRRHFMGSICMGNASVDYCIKQGLRWWKIDENTPLRRMPGPSHNEVTVTPCIESIPGWTGPVPQYIITEHTRPFYLPQGDDDKSLSPMRVDPGFERKA